MTSNRRRIAAQRRDKQTGSQIDGEPVFIAVGIARRPHGVRGELLVNVLTDFPERLEVGSRLFFGEEHRPVTIKSRRDHNDGLLLAFEEFPGRETLEHHRNVSLFVSVEDRPALESGEYYHHQLIGLTVVDQAGQTYGRLADILETGANDVYIVRNESNEETLFPVIPDVVLAVDLEQQQILVQPLPGLIPDPD